MTLKPKTRELVAALKRAGDEGLTTSQLVEFGIGSRFGARIAEARDAGYEITTERIPGNRARYRLQDSLSPPAQGGSTDAGADSDDSARRGTAIPGASRRPFGQSSPELVIELDVTKGMRDATVCRYWRESEKAAA